MTTIERVLAEKIESLEVELQEAHDNTIYFADKCTLLEDDVEYHLGLYNEYVVNGAKLDCENKDLKKAILKLEAVIDGLRYR